MVREDRLREILADSELAAAAVDALVAEANEMGGRDNITVVLFRLGGDEDGAAADGPAARRRSSACARRSGARTGEEPVAAAPRSRRSRAPPRPAARRRAQRGAAQAQADVRHAVCSRAGGRGGRRVARSAQVYFVGQDDRGLVTLYRGVPYELPLGIELYEKEYVSSVPARALSPTSAGGCSTTSCARATMQRTSCAAWSGADSERAQPRAARAVPVAMLITAGFTGVYAARSTELGRRA